MSLLVRAVRLLVKEVPLVARAVRLAKGMPLVGRPTHRPVRSTLLKEMRPGGRVLRLEGRVTLPELLAEIPMPPEVSYPTKLRKAA